MHTINNNPFLPREMAIIQGIFKVNSRDNPLLTFEQLKSKVKLCYPERCESLEDDDLDLVILQAINMKWKKKDVAFPTW